MQETSRQLPILSVLRTLDYLQIAVMVLLLGAGLLFIHSTGVQIDTEESRSFFSKQLIWIVTGAGVYTFIAMLDYRSPICRMVMHKKQKE